MARMPSEEIRRIVDDALNSAIPEPWEVSAHATARIEALFAPILAEKEREIATFDSREAEWNEAIANSLQNEEDAHRKLEDAEAALAAERERCAKIVEEFPYYHELTDEDISEYGTVPRETCRYDISAAIRAQIAAPGASLEAP